MSDIRYTIPAVKEKLLSGPWLLFFSFLFLVGIFLFLNSFTADDAIAALLFFGGIWIVFFSLIIVIRNIKFIKKYKYPRHYMYNTLGITIKYAKKEELYHWEDIQSWIESRELEQVFYSQGMSNRSLLDTVVSKTISNAGKRYLKTPNWISLTLKNRKSVLIEVPEEEFSNVKNVLDKIPKTVLR